MGINLSNAAKAALRRLIKRSAMRVNLQRMDFMNFRKGVLLMFVALIVGGSVLYAQNSMSLATGTYSCDDLGAGHTIKIDAKFYGDYSGDISPVRNFIQYMGNTVVARGTVSPPRRGEMEVNGDYSVTWTYVNSRTFIDQGGKTWRRIGS